MVLRVMFLLLLLVASSACGHGNTMADSEQQEWDDQWDDESYVDLDDVDIDFGLKGLFHEIDQMYNDTDEDAELDLL